MTVEAIVSIVGVVIVAGGVFVAVGRNMQKTKDTGERVDKVEKDVDNVYITIRKESKDTRTQIAAAHTEVLQVLTDHGKRIGQVEGELKRINGG